MKKILLKFDRFSLFSHTVPLLQSVSFEVQESQNVALVGRSGSGKSLLLAAAGYLLPFQTGWKMEGSIHYKDKNLFSLSASERRDLRGKEIACILQESMSCLNPSMKIYKQIEEGQYYAQNYSKTTDEWLELLKLNKKIANAYPHELSGGMRQRVSIAIALSTGAKLVLADEPTSALDKESQQIVSNVLKEHCTQHNSTLLLVTHDVKFAENLAEKTIRIEHGRIKVTDS